MRPAAVRVVSEDDPRIWRIVEASGGSRIGFALTEAGLARHPLVSVRDLENLGPAGLRFTLHIGSWRQRIDLPALGEHNAHNAAAAAAIAVALGITPENIAGACEGEFVVFDIAGNRAACACRDFVAEGDGGD